MALESKIYDELKRMNENIETLITIYRKVLDSVIPVEKPTREEEEAIKSSDELVGKEEFLKALEE